eukprot:TRINITY_DN252_c0_g1_i1.p1 TRINITY_DN252_c0_g1~~TRINITY_DN252_c0_g1_i1.p1  ORF type:complete len:162 (-),score=49.52 TRINITY_DN252_c0_g1_i1:295-780(-)
MCIRDRYQRRVRGFLHRIKMLAALRISRATTRTLSARTFRATPAVFEKLPEQPDTFPAGELINEITGANGLRREEIEAQALGLSRFEGEWSGPVGTKENPTVVESINNHRIVGIPRDDGHGGDAGEAKWFHLHAGEPIEIDGQYFVLKQVDPNVTIERAHH